MQIPRKISRTIYLIFFFVLSILIIPTQANPNVGSSAATPVTKWETNFQNAQQTLLWSSMGKIYIEHCTNPLSLAEPAKLLKSIGENIFTGETVFPVKSQQLAESNLIAGNFIIPLSAYVEPQVERLRILVYSDSLMAIKFVGMTRLIDFRFLEKNVDRLAKNFIQHHTMNQKSISKTQPSGTKQNLPVSVNPTILPEKMEASNLETESGK